MRVVEGSPKPDGVSDRNWKKVANLKRALNHIKDITATSGTSAMVPITVNIIQAVHQIVGHELIESAGEFRCTSAAAARTTVCYLEPELIQKRLPQLVRFVNEELRKSSSLDGHGRLKVTLRIAALFFFGIS